MAENGNTQKNVNDFRSEMYALKEIIETRITGIEKAIELFQVNLVRVPTELQKEISHLRDLQNEKFEAVGIRFNAVTSQFQEKFDGIALQFKERDTRTEQTSKDSKTAVDAALQAAKEAVGQQTQSSDRAIAKSEAATGKQIEQIGSMIAATNVSATDKIDDLKERLTTIEGRSKGVGDGWGLLVGGVGVFMAIIAAAAAVIALFVHR